jgi:putative ABC transport system ATP-binding protein
MDAPIAFSGLSHHYGAGANRRRVLDSLSGEIRAGEIVIVSGPSGSGKTTFLTLAGALRSAQEGSLRVLGRELRGASPRTRSGVRRNVGYIFQSHNLLSALTARENVEMSLFLQPGQTARGARARAEAMLDAVGLRDHLRQFPETLSGGQRQRVAIARALAAEPRIVLADEPTASLDRQSGRDVVDLMRDLARRQRTTVLIVTHDNRILDVADRIIHLEDGKLSPFRDAAIAESSRMLQLLAQSQRPGDLIERVSSLPVSEFVALLDEVTCESQRFLQITALLASDAFESMLAQAVEAFTFKLAQVLEAERASLFLVDEARGELSLRVAREERGRRVEARLPIGVGIAGRVAKSGEPLRVDDAYAHPLFNPEVDRETGFRTHTILCLPIRNRGGRVFAVAQLLNRRDGKPFDERDEARFAEFIRSLGVILETWARLEASRPGAQP